MLVADYSSSDEEEEGSEGQEKVKEVVEVGPIPPKKVYPEGPTTSSFNIQTKRVQGLVKITAPSLKDFLKDDEEPSTKKPFLEHSKKKSGLFAILPEPKNAKPDTPVSFLKKSSSTTTTLTPSASSTSSDTASSSSSSNRSNTSLMPRSLIPDSVKMKRPPPSKIEEIRAKYLKQDANVRIVSRSGKAALSSSTISTSVSNKKDSDDSDEDGEDFFSFNSVNEAETADAETLEKLKLPAPDLEQSVQPSSSIWQADKAVDSTSNEATATTSNAKADISKYLDKNQRKGKAEINIIDVNAADLRPDTTEWLRNITDQSAVPARRGKGLGGMQKRKHQITYLAFEAKAREQELQNQWAENRQSKRQTQQKYGF